MQRRGARGNIEPLPALNVIPHLPRKAEMDTEAQKRAEAAFVKKVPAEASSALTEYKAKEAAVDANTQRLRALRLARDAQVGAPTPPAEKSKPKVHRARTK